MGECRRSHRLLGLAATVSSLSAGVGGLAFYLLRDGAIHAVLGIFWLVMGAASWRTYRSLGC